MSSPGTTLRPEVAAFLARVREQLADLPAEERDELLEGLEADLSEQLAEGGELPDSTAYAAELRTAAGLPVSKPARLRTARRSVGARLDSVPDDLRRRWLALAQRNDLTRRAWTFLEALRPAWWVLRAWVAVTLLDTMSGRWEFVTVVPTLGVGLLGPALLGAAIWVSVLIGQGRLWPGSGPERTMLARLTLAALNVFAILAPFTFNYPGSHPEIYESYAPVHAVNVRDPSVLHIGPHVIRNIYAYDVDGKPLQGVQLFDQLGRPVAVAPQSSMGDGPARTVACPWFNGTTRLWNVFPLPQRTQRHGTCLGDVDPAKVGPQGFHAPPLASVPPATLPTSAPPPS
jgi:hypothetical protein